VLASHSGFSDAPSRELPSSNKDSKPQEAAVKVGAASPSDPSLTVVAEAFKAASSALRQPQEGLWVAVPDVNTLESFFLTEKRKAQKVSLTFFQHCSQRSLYAKV
jgi:hypothetical protein